MAAKDKYAISITIRDEKTGETWTDSHVVTGRSWDVEAYICSMAKGFESGDWYPDEDEEDEAEEG